MALTKIPASFLDKSSHVDFADNERLRIGTDNDLQIYYDGTNNLIQGSAGNVLYIQAKAGENSILAVPDGAVNLYHNNLLKFETSATGASVTGNLAVSGNLTVSGTTTELDTTNLNVTDKNITLNYHASSDTSSNADGAGITIQDAVNGSTDATITWVASSDEFAFSHPASIVNAVGGDTVLNLTGSYGGGNNVALLGFARSGGAVAGDIRYTDATTDMEIGTSTAHAFSLKTTNTKRLTVLSGGNVGIGTTSPNSLADLHVADTSDARIWLDATSGNTLELYAGSGTSIFNRSNSFLGFGVDNTEKMRINTGGNVGIGRTDPSQVLEVHKAAGGDQTVAKFSAHNYGDTGKTFIEIGTEHGDGSSRIGSFNDSGNKSVLVFNVHSATSGSFLERMRIDSSGRVGVGSQITSNQASTYDARANDFVISGSGDTGMTIAGGGSENLRLQFTVNGDTGLNRGEINYDNNDNSLSFATGGTNRMLLDSTGIDVTGNVDISVGQLDLDPNYRVRWNASNDYSIHSDANNYIRIITAGSERMRIDSAGTIFQGTTSPTLHSAVRGIVFENGSIINDVTRGAGKSMTLAQNAAVDSGNTWAYLATDEASYYQQFGGKHYFATAPSGSAGADITFDNKMIIDNDYVVPKMNFHYAVNNIYAVSTTGDELTGSSGVMILKQQISLRAGSKVIVWYDTGQILNNNQGGNGSTSSNPQIAIYVTSNSSAPASRGSAQSIVGNNDHTFYPAGDIGSARVKMNGMGATGVISTAGTYYIYVYGGSYNNGQYTYNYQNSSGNTRGSSIIWAEIMG